jgi:hypothetical protein
MKRREREEMSLESRESFSPVEDKIPQFRSFRTVTVRDSPSRDIIGCPLFQRVTKMFW